jgi:hypothetical protein
MKTWFRIDRVVSREAQTSQETDGRHQRQRGATTSNRKMGKIGTPFRCQRIYRGTPILERIDRISGAILKNAGLSVQELQPVAALLQAS